MATKLYKNTGAESNRSDNIELQATMTTSETTTAVNVTIDYYINKKITSGITSPGTRYGLLVQGFAVNDSGQITTRGTIIAAKQLTQIVDGSQSGSVTFSIAKGTSAKTYSGVTFLINDNSSSTKWSSDSTYMWTGQQGSTVSSTPDSFATTSFTVPVAYTACSAPTSISISKSIQKPGGNVTISWSGAKAGTNNPITGYFVYYRVGAAPTTSTYDGFISIGTNDQSGSSNTTFTIPNTATRGSIYYFKVRTTSGVGSSYYSAISSNSVTTKVNVLPNKPSVTPNKTTVPSSGGNVTFTLNATDKDGQTLSFVYSTTADGTKKAIDNGGSISVKEENTYYFYTYDGLEYSSDYTSQLILLNEKPTIGEIENEGTGTLYTSDLLNDFSYKNFYTKVSSTLSKLNKDVNNISWYCRYADILEDGSISSWYDYIELGDNNNLTVIHDLSLNPTFNILTNIVYQIGACYNDGIENSSIVWGATDFVIAPNPTIIDFFNQHNGSDVGYSIHKHFYNNGSIEATKDSSVTSINVSIDNNATIEIPIDSIDNYKTNGYFNINISNTSINTKYKLTVTINRIIGSSKAEFDITSAGLPYIGESIFTNSNISNQTNILKPYTSTGTFNIVLYNFFETLSYSSAKINYDGTNLPESCLSFNLINGENILNINPTYDENSSESSLYFNYSQDFYKKFLLEDNNPLNLDLDNINIVDLRVTFTDVFGQSYNITKFNYLTLDFRESFIKEKSSFSVKIIRNGAEISGTNHIMENDSLRFNFNWSAYNNQNTTIESYICRTNEYVLDSKNLTNWVKYQNDSNYIWNINTGTETITVTNLIRTGSNYINYEVGRLDKSYYVYFKIIATINGYSTSYYSGSFITQRHIPVPKISFTSVNYNSDNKQIEYIHSNYDTGGGYTPGDSSDTYQGIEKIEFGIQYATDFSIENSIKYINNEGTGISNFYTIFEYTETGIPDEEISTDIRLVDFKETEWAYYNIRLVVKTTIGNNIIISYGEETTIYNISPTIAYRKNHIGINAIPENFEGTDGFSTDESIKDTSVLVIQSSTNRNNIYFITPEHRIKFNINNGRIDGILLDADNWG